MERLDAMKKEDFESFKRGMAQARFFSKEGARDGYVSHSPLEIEHKGNHRQARASKVIRT